MSESIIEASQRSRGESKLKKIFKKKRWLIVVLAVILGGAYSTYAFVYKSARSQAETVQTKQWTVKTGDLTMGIEADGRIVADEGVELSFTASGDDVAVEEMYVKEGDSVKKGDKIAKVNVDSLQFDLRSAYNSYQSALASLNAKLAEPTEAEKSSAQASISQAELSLEQSKMSLEQTKVSAQQSIASAEQTLATAKTNLKLNDADNSSAVVSDAYEDLVSAIKSTSISINNYLLDADEVLGLDNKLVNDDFEDYLGVGNVSSLNSANLSYQPAKLAKEELARNSAQLSLSTAQSQIDAAAVQAQTAVSLMQTLLLNVAQVLDYSITSTDFTQTELSSYKSSISSARSGTNTLASTLYSDIQAITTAKNNLGNYQIAYNKAVADLQAAKDKAERDIATAESTVKARELSLEQAKMSYDDLMAPPREVDLASSRIQLANAAISVDKAKYNIEQATLTTPIDGEIVELNYKKGDIINKDSTEPVAVILNKNSLFIETNIEEADVNTIKVGQKAYVTFDALPDVKLEGEVSFVSLMSEVDNNGIATYVVRVAVNDIGGAEVREGMSAYVSFVIAETKNVLIIPVAAVRNVNGQPSVQTADGQWRAVTTGFTDGTQVEVISGLADGDSIIY